MDSPPGTPVAAGDPPADGPAPQPSSPDPPHVPSRPKKKATISEMKTELSALGLDTSGKKETLFKRLLAAFTRAQEEAAAAAAPRPRPRRQPHLSYLCFDVEGTCEAGKNFDYPNEIIEFPVVLLQWAEDDEEDTASVFSSFSFSSSNAPSSPRRTRRLHIIDTFHSYVRPTWRPRLSEFCTHLTGIQQSTVDAAPTFPEVLTMFENWLDSWGLRDGDRLKDALWVTDGPWDLRDFIPKQLHITPTSPPYPEYLLGQYLNLKRAVAAVLSNSTATEDFEVCGFKGTTKRKRNPTGGDRFLPITGQLQALGLGSFSGRQHSGVDDATNMARILIELTEREILIEPNAALPPARNAKRWPWMGKPGEVLWDVPMLEGLIPRPSKPLATSVLEKTGPAVVSEIRTLDDSSVSQTLSNEPAQVIPHSLSPDAPSPMLSNKKKKKKKKKAVLAQPTINGDGAIGDPAAHLAAHLDGLTLSKPAEDAL